MKTRILLSVNCLFWIATVHAQTGRNYSNVLQTSGIYLNSIDFRQSKLTVPIHCADKRSRIRLNEFFGLPHIIVIDQGQKHRFLKDTIFGLRDCEGHDFRLYHRKLFEIEEVKTIVIYRHVITESGVGNKGIRLATRFYFSTGVDSVIIPLTRTGLEGSFPRNEKLHDLLENWLQHSHAAINTYDPYYHMFKVNRLLQLSI